MIYSKIYEWLNICIVVDHWIYYFENRLNKATRDEQQQYEEEGLYD
jgi:hypothetical protein